MFRRPKVTLVTKGYILNRSPTYHIRFTTLVTNIGHQHRSPQRGSFRGFIENIWLSIECYQYSKPLHFCWAFLYQKSTMCVCIGTVSIQFEIHTKCTGSETTIQTISGYTELSKSSHSKFWVGFGNILVIYFRCFVNMHIHTFKNWFLYNN